MAANSLSHPNNSSQTKGLRVAIYARVSTLDQSTESHLLDLRCYASNRS